MTLLLEIHPKNPQPRQIQQAVKMLQAGAIIAYPTDSAYGLGCHLGDKKALEQIRRIRQLGKNHNFTLMCKDLSELATYTQVDNPTYRFLKAHTPGPYTFILKATREVPRRLQHPKRKTIGLRVPANKIVLSLLEELAEPLMTTSLILPEENLPLADPQEIHERLFNQIDAVIDGGFCGYEPTTVIDMVEQPPSVIRQGKGDISQFS